MHVLATAHEDGVGTLLEVGLSNGLGDGDRLGGGNSHRGDHGGGECDEDGGELHD